MSQVRIRSPRLAAATVGPEARPPVATAPQARPPAGAVPPSPSGRLGQLDGLRGVAACAVVLAHTLGVSHHGVADLARGVLPVHATGLWWLYRTPAPLLWSAGQAVMVFFVLSGFVLALPSSTSTVRDWLAYYPRRLLRLYPPVWGALVVAVCLRAVVARRSIGGATWFLDAHAVPASLHGLVGQAALWVQSDWAFDPVLWSLHWEVLFSLLLPLLLVALRALPRTRGWGGVLVLVLAAAAASGWGAASGRGSLEYLPVFLVGVALATHGVPAARAIRRLSAPAAAACVAVAAALLLFGCLGPGLARPGAGAVLPGLEQAATTAGAALVVLLAVGRPGWREALTARPLRWLGSRSFSLYLVHEPIVVSLAFATGGRPSVWAFVVVAPVASLVAAELFWRAVEAPSTRLSRRVGRALDARPSLRLTPAA